MTKEKVSGAPDLVIPGSFSTFGCAGCTYPLIQRLVCEVVEEMDLAGKAIGNAGAGCCAGFFMALDFDNEAGVHGRIPDVATGMKRLLPEAFILTLQGDGDTIAIGAEPLLGAATRAEKITVIMVNNGSYAMTGGQMAPTTLLGQITTTTPRGRNPDEGEGYPIQAAELVASLRGTAYSARGSVHDPANLQRTKKYLKAAFQKQVDRVGFGFIEILSTCPTNWHVTPLESLKWVEEKMIPEFPLGEFKNVDKLQ